MKTLVIKTGSLGDVVRTTVVLNQLREDEVHWVTGNGAANLLPRGAVSRVYDYRNPEPALFSTEFDRVLSLEESEACLKILHRIKAKRIIGVYHTGQGVGYTPETSYWFDMSLSSRHGREEADKRKKANRKTVPEILVGMLGGTFNGQEYDIGVLPNDNPLIDVGLIDVCGKEWPNKTWPKYHELSARLESDGLRVATLPYRHSLQDHIQDVNNCSMVVSGDTLGMHLALALKKKTVTLFTCTPPWEIEGYGRMRKIVSPRYEEAFMKRGHNPEVAGAISVDEVYSAVKDYLK